MVFQLSVGSRGLATEAYSVRIPIRIAPGQGLAIGQGVCFTFEHLRIEIVSERYFYSLTVGDFTSREDAAQWLNKFSVALFWVNIRLQLGLAFKSDAEGVQVYEQSEIIAPGSMLENITKRVGWRDFDGYYIADETVILPEHKKLIRELGGRPTLTVSAGFELFSEALEEGLRYPNPERMLANHKLRLALNIYVSSFYEASGAARFLSLMTVLEALAEPSSRPEAMVGCVQDFVDQLQSQRERLVGLCGEGEFASLVSSVNNLREKSIGQKIKSLLRSVLSDTPESVHLAQFGRLYEIRSRLVHQGVSEPSEMGNAISTLNILVPALLRSLLLQNVRAE